MVRPKIILSKELLMDLYNSGMSQEKVAEYFGVAQSTISNCMKENNINVRKLKILSKELVVNLCNLEMTQAEIAEYFNVSRAAVSFFMKKNNIVVIRSYRGKYKYGME